jgi:hypothetical protein
MSSFPVYQMAALESVMQGRAEYISGADFYLEWVELPSGFTEICLEASSSETTILSASSSETIQLVGGN